MPTLQSNDQHRQTNWFFDFREEGGCGPLERKKRRTPKRTVYEKECKGCRVAFKCEVKQQPYCSHECYAKSKSRNTSMLGCMICLHSLGFGIKEIGKRTASGHHGVRRALIKAGEYNPIRTMKIAANRNVQTQNLHGRKIQTRQCRSDQSAHTPIQKTRRLLRNQITRMCFHMRSHREMRTEQYVGCSFEEAKQRIESQFTRGMTWENCGSFWHLDHIVPLSSFNLDDPRQRMLANHISNLRPLNAKENIKKGNKIPIAHQFDLVAN
jgi:hypothetical protein